MAKAFPAIHVPEKNTLVPAVALYWTVLVMQGREERLLSDGLLIFHWLVFALGWFLNACVGLVERVNWCLLWLCTGQSL